ncbi:hypothetical protein MASR2M8_16780 [Opitutaceae bacterium]
MGLFPPHIGVFAGLLLQPLLLGGCLLARTVYAPVKLAGQTVIVAGETVGTAVITTGRVAGAALGATGTVTSDSLSALAALNTAGMVTFVDAASGAIVRVPWQEGMNLHVGTEAAKVRTARKVIDLVRAGRYLHSKLEYSEDAARIPIEAGDVVRISAR